MLRSGRQASGRPTACGRARGERCSDRRDRYGRLLWCDGALGTAFVDSRQTNRWHADPTFYDMWPRCLVATGSSQDVWVSRFAFCDLLCSCLWHSACVACTTALFDSLYLQTVRETAALFASKWTAGLSFDLRRPDSHACVRARRWQCTLPYGPSTCHRLTFGPRPQCHLVRRRFGAVQLVHLLHVFRGDRRR